MRKYQLKGEVAQLVEQQAYEKWLDRKARSHVRRDRKRGNQEASIAKYKEAIHDAVLISEGMDAYTGEDLNWKLLSKYNNEDSRKWKRDYKKKFALLPTVDHVGDGTGPVDFKICSWQTNDAKNDLSHDEFVALCRKVVAFADNEG